MNEARKPDSTHSRSRSGFFGHSFSEAGWGYLCAGPALALLTVVALVPIFGAVWLGFQRHLPIFGIHEFVYVRNYLALLQDDRFWAACATTMYFTAVSVTAEVILGLGVALFLDRLSERAWLTGAGEPSGRQWSWMQAVVLVPWAIPTVVSARMWDWLYQPEQGVLNYLLLRTGLIREPVLWLGDPTWAIHAAILMDVWKATPFAALLLLAGLKAIPRDLSQAALVDGARAWDIFLHVTLPLLTPVILIVLVFRTMDAFRVFDAVYVLTGGGPGNSTETLSIYAYKALFQTLQFGYGSALASMMFVAMLIITGSYLLLMRRRLREVA
jgi:multiple sugar transport system permease protein